jgi:hypothetical protein
MLTVTKFGKRKFPLFLAKTIIGNLLAVHESKRMNVERDKKLLV